MSVKQDVGVEQLIAAAEADGVAVSTVKDGHVLVFMKQHLEKFLEKINESGQDRMVVFVQRREFKN